MIIIDRRLNHGKKSAANRQRAMERSRDALREAARAAASNRSITQKEGEEVVVKTGALEEPVFHRVFDGGTRHIVLGGNKEFIVGDRIPKEKRGDGSGSGGSPDGDGDDEFRWMLSQDEFLDLIFSDLQLPHLLKKSTVDIEAEVLEREGLTQDGAPSQLDLVRSFRRSLSRRVSLNRPKKDEIQALEREIEGLEGEEKEEAQTRLEMLRKRAIRVPYFDHVDLRYRRYEMKPQPITKAVVFLMMDVSGSMTEEMKDIAKRFFLLVYTFLTRQYKHVDIVFIRHTSEAAEVDEQTFFYSTETGGTIISTAFELMQKIQKERFSATDYNIYACYAGDGDNFISDNTAVADILETMLPLMQYCIYAEVGDNSGSTTFWGAASDHGIWKTAERLSEEKDNFAAVRMLDVDDVYPLFRELFSGEKG